MSLIKFRNRRPFGNLVTTDFFDMDDFFETALPKSLSAADRFWNGKSSEPALNIKETDDHFEIELASPEEKA